MKLSENQKGILALISLALVYASMGIFVRYLALSFSLFQQLYLRLFAASLMGFLVFWTNLDFSKLKKISIKEWGLLVLRSLCYYLVGVALFTHAVLLTKISTVSFIGALPMTAVLGFVILREKATFTKIFYILLAFLGVTIISVKDFTSVFSWGLGEAAAMISVLITSYAIVMRKFHSRLLNDKEITQIMIFLGFVFVFFTSIFSKESLPAAGWSAKTVMVLIFAGLLNVALMFLTNYGFKRVRTSTASNLLTLEMLFAVILGIFLYGEIPTIKEMAGAVLILVSVIGMNRIK